MPHPLKPLSPSHLVSRRNGESTATLPESPRKRVKCENGVSMATDFSESAVHATHSQQLEDYSKLAISTTFLPLSTTPTQLTSAVAPALPMMMHAAKQHQAAAPPLPCSLPLSRSLSHLRSCTVISLA
jgi:hypothetical protein